MQIIGFPRATTRLALALLVSLSPVVAGCRSESHHPAAGAATSQPSATVTAKLRVAPYAVKVELPPAAAGASPEVLITNTGQRKDRYLVRLTPPAAGVVVPDQVALEPGQALPLRLVSRGDGVTVTVYSLGRDDTLAELEIPTTR